MLIRTFILTGLILLIAVSSALSQQADFRSANRMMQEQNFEQAIPILTELHEMNPGSTVYFERLVEALINNGNLNQAEKVVRDQIDREITTLQARAKLGEILHLKNEKDEALSIWNEVLEENPQNIQATYIVASSMTSRQEFDAAIEAYRSARENQNEATLFLNELANTYLLAGRFDEAVNEYFTLIMESPQQMAIVQQRFFQMRDEQLYDIASFELEDLLLELSPSHEAYSPLYQLLSWLLIETEQYERSYNFAQHYEEETSYTVYSLFELGNRLVSAKQFQIAEEAYSYYLESSNLSVRKRAYDELSNTYLQWAKNSEQNNLLSADSIRSLYRKSYHRAEELMNEFSDYEQSGRVLSRLTDLSLDFMQDTGAGKKWLDKLQAISGGNNPYTLYAEGRIAIFEEQFGESRRLLARADRATDESNLSEKVRYYTALSDIFSGDPEFAEIQLRSLERRNSSYYANDAVRLRMWIQNGLRADSTGQSLKKLGNGLFHLHTGKNDDALEILQEFFENPGSPFADDLAVELSAQLPVEYTLLKLQLLENQAENQSQSPLLERILWDRALLAEQIAAGKIATQNTMSGSAYLDEDYKTITFTPDEAESLFEELIISFPDGYYANYAREKLKQFQIDYL